jgi:drug/metabolite transporter (DMT)-like permease
LASLAFSPGRIALSQPSQQLAPIGGAAMRGILLKIASVSVFVTMATLLKAADVPAGQMVFFRSFFAVFPIVAYLAWRGQLIDGFTTSRPMGHVLRGIIGTTSMALGFFGLTLLPLPEATAITYATPLVLVILSALILKEDVRLYRWSAVIIGLAGVLIVMWPRLTVFSGGDMAPAATLGAIAALSGAIVAAFAMMQVRRLVMSEKTATIVLYFSLTSSALALLTLPFGWVMPSPWQLAMLVSAGFCGGLGQILLTSSYRHADMSIIAPFEYTSILLATALGFLIFGDVPTPQILLGGAIVIASGIFVIFREHQLGLRRAEAKSASSPEG